MITTIIDEDNKEHTFVTQQYNVGLYCIVDNDPAQQSCYDTTEVEFHTELRRNYKFNPNKSSVI